MQLRRTLAWTAASIVLAGTCRGVLVGFDASKPHHQRNRRGSIERRALFDRLGSERRRVRRRGRRTGDRHGRQ